jgi:hypothetical protein
MPGFRHRLSRTQQRIYDRSDAVSSIAINASPRLRHAVAMLPGLLQSGVAAHVERAAQVVCEEICTSLGISQVRVRLSGSRPSNTRGELHGLYTAPDGSTTATIKIWMLTAKRGQVVAFKTFLRTLLHEICHHLDYAHLRLDDSFHTPGFYKRESSLFYQIGAAEVAATSADRTAGTAEPTPRRGTGRPPGGGVSRS